MDDYGQSRVFGGQPSHNIQFDPSVIGADLFHVGAARALAEGVPHLHRHASIDQSRQSVRLADFVAPRRSGEPELHDIRIRAITGMV